MEWPLMNAHQGTQTDDDGCNVDHDDDENDEDDNDGEDEESKMVDPGAKLTHFWICDTLSSS